MNRLTLPLALALLAGLSSAFSAGSLRADDASEPKTFMAERGKLLLSDDLDKPLAKPWTVAKGKWENDGGAVRVSELAADKHGAVARHPLATRNFVAQYSIKLDGAKATSFSVNDAKGHCCRVSISPTSLAVQKDSHDHNKEDKQLRLDVRTAPIALGEWHTVVIEVLGPEIVASLDGDRVALGSHESLDVDKTNFGLTVAGETVSYKNLRVWEATPKQSWESTKAELKQRAAK
jgi:hypothetical protein